jgi:hypothetical protein
LGLEVLHKAAVLQLAGQSNVQQTVPLEAAAAAAATAGVMVASQMVMCLLTVAAVHRGVLITLVGQQASQDLELAPPALVLL